MNDEKWIEEMFEKIAAVPKIPRNVREKEFKGKCPCGGTITAWRVRYNGHYRAYCDKCDFKMIE